jgi:hypothetical protein
MSPHEKFCHWLDGFLDRAEGDGRDSTDETRVIRAKLAAVLAPADPGRSVLAGTTLNGHHLKDFDGTPYPVGPVPEWDADRSP